MLNILQMLSHGNFTLFTPDISSVNSNQQMPDYHVKLTAVPWRRGLMLIETGQGFALDPPYFRPDERPYMKYSVALFDEELSIFCDSAIIAKRKPKVWPDDYFNLTIGINAGYLSGGKTFAMKQHGEIKKIVDSFLSKD
jgi:hypothetical protein